MRPYGAVSPLFWTGKTGKKLRDDRDSQVVALYLMTNPHSHQTGLYYLPLMYLAHEVGIPLEGARKALFTLSEDGFCRYDEVSEWIWVCEMAAWQIGTSLKETDKRVLGVQQFLESVPALSFIRDFTERYRADFHLGRGIAKKGPKAPSEGHSSNRTGHDRTGSGKEHEENHGRKGSSGRGSRIPEDFSLTDERRRIAVAEGIDPDRTFAKFVNFWRAKSGEGATKRDWDATWQNWCMTEGERGPKPRGAENGLPTFRPS